MKIKVVVDTNSIDNSGVGNKLFGQREVLKSIINKIELYVPEIVIDEIVEHKRKCFSNKSKELARNEVFKIGGGNIEEFNKLNVEDIILDDLNTEDIPYNTLKIDNYKNFFEKFKALAIKKKPPFKNDSDAGIKDAIIAYNVEKLLEEIDDEEEIILVSGDGRLREYFEKNERVRTVDNIFGIGKLIEHDNGLVKKRDNKIKIGFAGIRPKTDQERKIEKMLTNLRNSISFQKTHEFIGALKKNKQFLTNENKADIIKSALSNSQIRWIIKDQDVSDFLLSIYFDCIKLLNRDETKEFEYLVGIEF